MKKFSMVPFILIAVLLCTLSAKAGGTKGDPPPKVGKPVPVVQPKDEKKDEKKDDDFIKKNEKIDKKNVEDPPTAVIEETSGILPLVFVRNKVDAMPVGTKAYVSVDCIKCDSKRRVWLDPDQVYGTQNEGRLFLVTRDTNGYHLTLDSTDHQWNCQELPSGVKWLPIKSVISR